MLEKSKYSIIVPVYNSETSLQELFDQIQQYFTSIQTKFEVVFVDDGSADKSWEVLSEIKNQNFTSVIAIKLSQNYGQHNATFCGLKHATGDFLITIDDDLQVSPSEIGKLIEKYNETNSELVYGSYIKKKHSTLRNAGSQSFNQAMFNSPREGSSFRMITRDLAEKLILHFHNFVYIDELLLWYTGDISFADVEHHERKYKQSGYTPLKLFKLAINIIIYYTTIPLKLMVYGGFLASLISFLIGTRFIIRKIIFDVPLGYTSLIVAILFSTGMIMLCLGVIGEYISRIYKVQNHKPPYSIKTLLK